MADTNEDLVQVANVPNEAEAAAIVTVLSEAGITATSVGHFTVGFRAEAPGLIQVLVAASDAERAVEVIEAKRAEAASVDWDEVDIGNPEVDDVS